MNGTHPSPLVAPSVLMHFVAKLAFHRPIPTGFDVPLVTLSWLANVGARVLAAREAA
jgi:NO-binding membrane sensor protein with MHYT domain